jgi:tripartite-type tricarboxylate transporter receptor subunit TctC
MVRLLAALAAAAAVGAAQAQPDKPPQAGFPDKPLKMMVAWPAGGGTDNAARLVAEGLRQKMGQAVVVENRAGANGIIGTGAAAKMPADGYTLLFATADTHSINPHVYTNLPYDALKDFEPVALVGRTSFVLISSSKFAPNTLQELIALARKEPGKISYGTWGIGSTAHLGMVLFESAAGIELLHVPFQGSGPATNALLGGQVDLYLSGANGAAQHRTSGRVKIFGIAGKERSAAYLPDVPTFTEQGLAGAESGGWYGIVMPAGAPPAIRDRLSSEIIAIVRTPAVSQKLVASGWDVAPLGPAEFGALMRAEYERYGKIVKARGIQVTR